MWAWGCCCAVFLLLSGYLPLSALTALAEVGLGGDGWIDGLGWLGDLLDDFLELLRLPSPLPPFDFDELLLRYDVLPLYFFEVVLPFPLPRASRIVCIPASVAFFWLEEKWILVCFRFPLCDRIRRPLLFGMTSSTKQTTPHKGDSTVIIKTR